MNPESERKLKELGLMREELQELEMEDDLAKLDTLLEKYRAKGYSPVPETRAGEEILNKNHDAHLRDLPRIPFEIQGHHRHDLRSWLRQRFPFVEHAPYSQDELTYLGIHAGEVLLACYRVKDIDLAAGSAYIDYYKKDWETIEAACTERDFEKLGHALDDLLGGIDLE